MLDKSSTLTTAIVTNNNDPDNLGRVKIKYPWSLDNEESYWARISSPMAGNDSGTYFIPEVDDEVLVAFISGNIEYPIIIGSLWNQSDIPPEKNNDGKNNIRKIKSRSGHEIIFDDNDKGDTKLEITSSSGHKILLDDTKGSENIKIEDNSGSSIKIDSVSNIVTIKSNLEVSIKATNISLDASGELVLKGSLIRIN